MFSKKIILFAALATSLFAASCLKSSDTKVTPPPPPQDPSLEMNSIDSFTNAMGYTNMQYDPNLLGFKYEILNMGDTVNGKITASSPIGVIKYIGKRLNGVAFDSSYKVSADSTVIFNFKQFSVIGAWGYALFPQVGPYKIGKGGHIRFVTPSAYAYGGASQGGIPANSPLFFDIVLKDVRSY